MLVLMNESNLDKVLHYKGFKFIVKKEKNKKGETVFLATTPHYNNGASGIAGTVSGSMIVTTYRLIKLLQNMFLSIQVLPKIGDTYHDFDGSGKIRTIVDLDKDGEQWVVKTRRRTKDMHAQIMINPKSGAVNISLACVNEPDAVLESFTCDNFVILNDGADAINVDGRKHQWDLFVWKGVMNEEQVQTSQDKAE